MKHLKYASYLLRHKWYVTLECWKRGLFWRGLIHDWSKVLPSEWIPYANFFYGGAETPRGNDGYYKPTDTGDYAFDFAWLLHQKRHDHHWQWWVLPEDDGGIKVLPMSPAARIEMLCDWKGAGKAQRKPDTAAWYAANRHKMQLHPETRNWIESQLTPIEELAPPKMSWLRKLFCRHLELAFERNIYGDEINHSGGKRSLWRCSRCGVLRAKAQLRRDSEGRQEAHRE